jgi:hypothetical protein
MEERECDSETYGPRLQKWYVSHLSRANRHLK